jgi:hypothetical protein
MAKFPKAISDKFVEAYLETALWSSNDESDESGGEPLDKNYGTADIAEESIAKAIKDCNSFIKANGADLEEAGDDSQNGHDFWLTRNGHGAGFWDRGYEAGVSKRLTDAAHAAGSSDAYVGDDGKVYLT